MTVPETKLPDLLALCAKHKIGLNISCLNHKPGNRYNVTLVCDSTYRNQTVRKHGPTAAQAVSDALAEIFNEAQKT